MRHFLIFGLGCILLFSCGKDPVIVDYKTEYVVLIVVDGARYSETWGDDQHRFISHRYSRRGEAVICTEMRNQGVTNTMNGHTAILTGRYQQINNSGTENPEMPGWLHYGQEIFGQPADKFWLIASKDKIQALANCTNPEWKDLYMPMTDCGVNGINTGYRHDTTTFQRAKMILTTFHPKFVMINFREPDYSAHSGDSLGYLQGIRDTDSMAIAILDFLQDDPFYAGKTTFIITNDHGRHLPGQGGYTGHGDNCEGCRHIEFFAVSPDFKSSYISHMNYEQIDISATIAELTGMEIPTTRGKVMWDLLKTYDRWE